MKCDQLKAETIVPQGTTITLQMYPKSEADAAIEEKDKVIANKDYEIDELKKSIGKLLKVKNEQVMDEVLQKCLIYGECFVPVEHAMRLVAELRHANYKRCLEMAEMLEHVCPMTVRKAKWKGKWHKRWLELAEKFKPNNSTAQ